MSSWGLHGVKTYTLKQIWNYMYNYMHYLLMDEFNFKLDGYGNTVSQKLVWNAIYTGTQAMTIIPGALGSCASS